MVEDEQAVYTDPDGKVWHPHRGYWCWKVSSELAQVQERIKELEAQLDERVKVKPLDEDDYEEIVNAAGVALRNASYGIRGQVITVHDSLDWWVMKETERRILSTLEATPPAPKVTDGEWRYEIKYGPEGEANYAFVYDDSGHFVSNLKVHHAIAVVAAMNAALTLHHRQEPTHDPA